MDKNSLLRQHLNQKLQAYAKVQKVTPPPTGWIRAIRTSLGMSMEQLGKKLSVSRQAVLDMERREQEGSITIKSLKEIAHALDMQLVYGFVPNDGSLDALIEKKARDLATRIVKRTAQSMVLEDQANSYQRLKKAVNERTAAIIEEMPKILWD